MDPERKALRTRETRLRRAAERQGYRLVKSRRRDPRALDYGLYWVVDPRTSGVVSHGSGHDGGSDLDGIEEWLNQGGQRSR